VNFWFSLQYLTDVYSFVLPDSPAKARFLNHDEKIIAFERLRANNQGTETKVWKWDQVYSSICVFLTRCLMFGIKVAEVFLDLKTYLWFALLFLCAVSTSNPTVMICSHIILPFRYPVAALVHSDL
jgi:hypothetical protein